MWGRRGLSSWWGSHLLPLQLGGWSPSPSLGWRPHAEPDRARVDVWGKRFGLPLLTIQGLVPGPLPSLDLEKSLSFCSPGSLPQLDAGVGALFLLWLQQTSSWQRDHCRKERKRPGPPGFIFLKMMLPHLSTYVPSGTVHSCQERGATPVSIDNQ